MSSAPRKLHRKTRTGCRTCKQGPTIATALISQLTLNRARRVKCDESYPACRRCITLGRICDGYGVWGGGGALTQGSMPLVQASSSSSLTTASNILRCGPTSTPGLHVSSEQQVYLEWFIHGTATKPPRIFNSPFWDPTILQATVHEPMILQALLALSAAHKRHILDPINRARPGLAPDALEVFLLKHYGTAIKGLQNHLNKSEKLSGTRVFALVTMCALFVLLELMRGRFEEARMHLSNGARIAEYPVSRSNQAGLSSRFLQFFPRLQDQTLIFQYHSPIQQSSSIHSTGPPALKLRFASPEEAGHTLDDLIEQVACLAEQIRSMPSTATAARAIHVKLCRYLLSSFESWSIACKTTTAEQRLSLTPSDAAKYESLFQRFRIGKSIAAKCVGLRIDPVVQTTYQYGREFS